MEELLICFAASALVFHAVEFEKFIKGVILRRNKQR
jgi:hypothetical protein